MFGMGSQIDEEDLHPPTKHDHHQRCSVVVDDARDKIIHNNHPSRSGAGEEMEEQLNVLVSVALQPILPRTPANPENRKQHMVSA